MSNSSSTRMETSVGEAVTPSASGDGNPAKRRKHNASDNEDELVGCKRQSNSVMVRIGVLSRVKFVVSRLASLISETCFV